MNIIQHIDENIKWLNDNVSSQQIATKLEVVEKLSICSYYLSTLVSEAHEAKNNAEYMYKSSLTAHQATTEGAVSKVEIAAKHANKDFYKTWIDAENRYKMLQLKLSAVYAVIEQARQTCSFLKQEIRHGGGF